MTPHLNENPETPLWIIVLAAAILALGLVASSMGQDRTASDAAGGGAYVVKLQWEGPCTHLGWGTLGSRRRDGRGFCGDADPYQYRTKDGCGPALAPCYTRYFATRGEANVARMETLAHMRGMARDLRARGDEPAIIRSSLVSWLPAEWLEEEALIFRIEKRSARDADDWDFLNDRTFPSREDASQWMWDNVPDFRTNPHLYRVVQVPEAD